ncbi:unnamed protein product [Ceratitis capitata]|uniref:(Mediterranean fruit fly) hypothetical protein n=1 Tax=Ceratitis capitata TaxID=7213 RepID=A0A811UKI1_CERCA|nr:unnamed protein product [Ceratitis capitata]
MLKIHMLEQVVNTESPQDTQPLPKIGSSSSTSTSPKRSGSGSGCSSNGRTPTASASSSPLHHHPHPVPGVPQRQICGSSGSVKSLGRGSSPGKVLVAQRDLNDSRQLGSKGQIQRCCPYRLSFIFCAVFS